MSISNFPQDPKNNPSGVQTPKSFGTEVKGKAQELASDVSHKAQDVASDVAQKAKGFASDAAHKAQETASTAVEKTNEGLATVGQKMSSLAGTIREGAPHNRLGPIAETVADNLQAGGQYLQGHNLDAMGKDVTEVIRQHPLPSVFIGLGIGCLLGMALSRR